MPKDPFPTAPNWDAMIRFAPGIESWVTRLRAGAATRSTVADFPDRLLGELARFERDTEVDRSHPLLYYVALAFGCLTTAFIMTQRHAAIRRLETSANPRRDREWLPAIRSGDAFATVGISHLTTSRRHWAVPPVSLRWDGDEGVLEGSIPWVTGAVHAHYIVAGAVDADDPGQQYLVMLELPRPGLKAGLGMELVALTSSCTDVVELRGVRIGRSDVLHGPSSDVMASSNTGGAGGLQTSALALGLAASAIEYLGRESESRPGLGEHAQRLCDQWDALVGALTGNPSGTDAIGMRKGANDLALDATHAALSAAKGAGFVHGHPAGRWCREALFFLVWSCPQVVADAHLCTFSGWQS